MEFPASGSMTMSKFLGPFKLRLISETANDGRGEFAVLGGFRYRSDLAQREFQIPEEFHTDLESCPRLPHVLYLLLLGGDIGAVLFILSLIVLATLGNITRKAAVLHDALYVTKPVSRAMADAILYEAAVASGIKPWKARGLWIGVRLGGWIAWYNVFRWHMPKR